MMNPQTFVDQLSSLSFENTFNPYSNRCKVHDCDEAPMLRRAALLAMLKVAVESDIDSIWIGRDLGYRGGRRTGLALTDDIHIYEHAARWGVHISRPTKGEIVTERTAAVIWDVLSQIDARIFLWNVFPLHPHEAGQPFSNRSHKAHERRIGEDFLQNLVELIQPRQIVAIGNDAAITAYKLFPEKQVVKVRHPSYGGQAQFVASIQNLYNLSSSKVQHSLFE